MLQFLKDRCDVMLRLSSVFVGNLPYPHGSKCGILGTNVVSPLFRDDKIGGEWAFRSERILKQDGQ